MDVIISLALPILPYLLSLWLIRESFSRIKNNFGIEVIWLAAYLVINVFSAIWVGTVSFDLDANMALSPEVIKASKTAGVALFFTFTAILSSRFIGRGFALSVLFILNVFKNPFRRKPKA